MGGARRLLRRDHVAGTAFVITGSVVLAASRDLPFGTLASPGAGMLPLLAASLMMALGAILVARAGESPPLSALAWRDLPHAARVVSLMVAAAAAYTTLGFLVTMPALLFLLLVGVERRPLLPAAVFSLGVPLLTYLVFQYLLKSRLEPGLFRF
jgi:hypothetical protein